MADRIEMIRLRCCRGATNSTDISIDKDKPFILIYGENGTGKSTIIDAIDMVCNGTCGSLDSRSSASVKEHVPAIGSKATDVEVEIVVNGASWRAKLKGSRVVGSGPEPRPAVCILRRSQLQRLVEAQPAARYKELARFIDVAGVEASEQALKDAIRDAYASAESESRSRQEADGALRTLWKAEGAPGQSSGSYLDWAAEKSAADTTVLQDVAKQLEGLLKCIARTVSALDAASKAHIYKKEMVSERQIALDYADAMQGISGLASIGLSELLEEVNRYIALATNLSLCPLCEQPVVAEDIRIEISNRLNRMSQYRVAGQRVRNSQLALESAEKVAAQFRAYFVEEAVALAQFAFSPQLDQYLPAGIHASDYALLTSSNFEVEKAILKQARLLTGCLDCERDNFEQLRNSVQRDLSQFHAIRIQYKRLSDATDGWRLANELHLRLKRAHVIVHRERIQYSQAILDAVSSECSRLYSRIHPGERLGMDRLRLDENLRGSLHQDGNFEGIDSVPPQAFFSESHLDTLGFCFWLAVAKHTSKGQTIVALDDVFGSADSAHIMRIIELLMEECDAFNQVLVTTHSRAWRDAHRYDPALANKTHVIELGRWKRSRGIRPQRTIVAIEDLVCKLEETPFDLESIAGTAEILLGQVLDHLTLLYRLRVPRSLDGDYVLGDLARWITTIAKQLKVRQPRRNPDGEPIFPVDEEEIPIGPFLEGITSMTYLRNQVGRRFDARGAHILEVDVKAFANLTVELARLLVCIRCGEPACQIKGWYFTCSCNELKMEPLELV